MLTSFVARTASRYSATFFYVVGRLVSKNPTTLAELLWCLRRRSPDIQKITKFCALIGLGPGN